VIFIDFKVLNISNQRNPFQDKKVLLFTIGMLFTVESLALRESPPYLRIDER